MSLESFEQFRTLVLQDQSLQERLRATTDRNTFLDLVVQMGEERGFQFTAQDVDAAMQASRRAWIERWI